MAAKGSEISLKRSILLILGSSVHVVPLRRKRREKLMEISLLSTLSGFSTAVALVIRNSFFLCFCAFALFQKETCSMHRVHFLSKSRRTFLDYDIQEKDILLFLISYNAMQYTIRFNHDSNWRILTVCSECFRYAPPASEQIARSVRVTVRIKVRLVKASATDREGGG